MKYEPLGSVSVVETESRLALGHLVRIHGRVGDAAVAAVGTLADDAALSGAAQDALEDVEIFTRPK